MAAEATRGLSVKLIPEDKALRIQLRGGGLAQSDARTLASCASALAACAERHGCVDGGLSLTERCFNTLVGHNLQSGCAAASFGLAAQGEELAATHPRVAVSTLEEHGGLEIRLNGEGVSRIDHRLLEGCLNAALECAATRGCLAGGLEISEACAETLVRHNSQAGCVGKAFGLTRF